MLTCRTAKNLPLYRDEINSQLLYPLSKATSMKAGLGKSFTFTPYQQRLMAILNGIETEICWWLKMPRPGVSYDKSSVHASKAYGKASTTHSYGKGSTQKTYSKAPTHAYGKASTTHTHTTSKSHGQRSTHSGKTHDQRSSRPTQARVGQRQKRSSSPQDKSGGCAVM